MKKLLFLLASIPVLVSCGKKNEEEYKYELVENGCSTGEQKTDSKDKMCALLKDGAANNHCAHSLRKQKFEGDGCGAWGG